MYTYEKKGKEGQLKVKISAEVWEKAVEEAYQKNKGKYNIQGFRKGKAPRKVIEQNYGDTIFFDEAFEEAGGPSGRNHRGFQGRRGRGMD